MIRIHFEQTTDPGRVERVVDWPAVPRVGDDVDLTQGQAGSVDSGFVPSVVRSVVWWTDGTVRIVLR